MRSFLLLIAALFLAPVMARADGATYSELMGSGIAAEVAKLIGESRAAGLTAAGTTQGTATAIKSSVNTFTTVTTASAEGARLPTKSVVARDVFTVINNGAGILKVYPPTGGSINNGSTNAAIQIQSGGDGRFMRTSSTAWTAIGLGITSFETAISSVTAAGTTIADCTALTTSYTNVTTTAASTGVCLWDAPVGATLCVRNGGANALAIYPHGASGVINGGAGGASVSVATLATACFIRVTSGASGIWMGYEAPAA